MTGVLPFFGVVRKGHDVCVARPVIVLYEGNAVCSSSFRGEGKTTRQSREIQIAKTFLSLSNASSCARGRSWHECMRC